MIDTTTAPTISTSVLLEVQGLWLPVGRTSFFDFQQDRGLIERCNAYDKDDAAGLTGYTIGLDDMGGKRLSESVYHRLVNVLSSGLFVPAGSGEEANQKRYSRAYPMYNVRDLEQYNKSADPDTVALVCLPGDIEGPEWAGIKESVLGLVLMVVSEGLYVWFVPYTGCAEPTAQAGRAKAVHRALTAHIHDLVGGAFYSHSSGRPKTAPYVAGTGSYTLEDYRDLNLGFLTYSQINMIFEGLYNAMLDPQVFFDHSDDGSRGDTVKRTYTLGKFAELIRTDVNLDPENKPLEGSNRLEVATQDLLTLLSLRDTDHQDKVYYFELFRRLRENCLNVWVRRDILRQFMRRTSVETLNLNIYRVQSCGRALIGSMIRVAHLHRPLVQVDVPVPRPDVEMRSGRYVIPDGATEGQLRGYILLLAAKFPLVESTYHYLNNTVRRLRELLADEYPDKQPAELDKLYVWRSIAGVNSARDALLTSLRDSIKGLEGALEQAYMDNMLIETERIRTEEETLTEIERVRERENGSSVASANVTAGVISNALAFIAVLATLIIGIQSGNITLPTNWASFLGDISNVPIIVVVGIGLFIAYLGIQLLLDALLLRPLITRWLRRRVGDEQYFYEMDVRLDAPVGQSRAEKILAGKFPKPMDIMDWSATTGKARSPQPRVVRGGWWRGGHDPFRSSYRVSRTANDDASHKMYVVASVVWPRKWLRLPWFARKRVRLVLMYEVLYHTPVNVARFELRNVRVVSAAKRVLEPQEVKQLELLVAHEFINRWLDDPLTPQDALFSLVRMDHAARKVPAPLAAGPTVSRHAAG